MHVRKPKRASIFKPPMISNTGKIDGIDLLLFLSHIYVTLAFDDVYQIKSFISIGVVGSINGFLLKLVIYLIHIIKIHKVNLLQRPLKLRERSNVWISSFM